VPLFIDLTDYKPVIERKVSEATGRSFSIGDDLSLSLFPWAGLSLKDLQLGNAPGFKEKEMLTIQAFQVQVKLLPLLFKDIQIKRFALKEPRVLLAKRKDGHSNWESIGKPSPIPEAKKEKQPASGGRATPQIPLAALAVGELTIENGAVHFTDQSSGQAMEASHIDLKLTDVSFDQPIQIGLAAQLNQKPVQLKGHLGPLGKDFLTGSIPLELSIKAFDEVETSIAGHVSGILLQPQFQLVVETNTFSPKNLLAALGPGSKIETTDPDVLNNLSFKSKIAGSLRRISLSDGAVALDDSHIKFFATAKDFHHLNLSFDVKIDAIDIDRYLPPKTETKGSPPPSSSSTNLGSEKPTQTDYSPLRKMILDGTLTAEHVKVKNARLENLHLKLKAQDGLIRTQPLGFDLYQGSAAAIATIDVRQNTPATAIQLTSQGINMEILLKDVLNKQVLEGTFNSELRLNVVGDTPELIKRSIQGLGQFQFNDGAIVGVDIAGMVRNVQSAFGLGGSGAQKPRTDYTELFIPFTLTKGRFHTPDSKLASPLLRLKAKGNLDLVEETIDMRIEPKVVATLVGQGDSQQRTGLVEVPVLVSGTFTDPIFRPDLEALLTDKVKKSVTSEIEKRTHGKIKSKEVTESVNKLIKGFTGGD
jgi:AsmA protein